MDLSDVSEEASYDQFQQQMNILENSFTSSIDKINMFCEAEEGGNVKKMKVLYLKRENMVLIWDPKLGRSQGNKITLI